MSADPPSRPDEPSGAPADAEPEVVDFGGIAFLIGLLVLALLLMLLLTHH